MREELKKELEARGTAEVNNGIVTQVTQALSETDEEIEFLLFGERQKQRIMPIDEACAKCDFWRDKFPTTKECQVAQSKDAVARGFNILICPEQFID